MGFIKDKYFFWGILTGVLWTGFGVLILLFFLSNDSIEDSLSSLYYQNKLTLPMIKEKYLLHLFYKKAYEMIITL